MLNNGCVCPGNRSESIRRAGKNSPCSFIKAKRTAEFLGLLPPIDLGVVVLDVNRHYVCIDSTLADCPLYSRCCNRYLPRYASDRQSDLWARVDNTAEI